MHILPYYVLQIVDFIRAFGQIAEREQQVAARVFQPLAMACKAECLTGAAAFENIDVVEGAQIVIGDLCDIAEVWNTRGRECFIILWIVFGLFLACREMFRAGRAAPAPH